ncbi:MAG: serine hydrolase domain-containing protein [Acidimicrobiales bacterium]
MGILERSTGRIEEFTSQLQSGAVLDVGVIKGDRTDGWPADGQEPRFHVGSVTKPFTALLLADMVTRGEITLDTAVGSYTGVSRTLRDLRIEELVTHTSGLPRVPPILALTSLRRLRDPYSVITAARMARALRLSRSSRRRGSHHYSNFGYGILGHVLGAAVGCTFQALLHERVLAPLGLLDTVFDIESEDRLLPGHSTKGRVVPHWHNPAMAGCGSLLSTRGDLLRFLAAQVDPPSTPMAAALELTHRPMPLATSTRRMGLGWMISRHDDKDFYWHNGATFGFGSFLAFQPDLRTGVVLLLNQASPRKGRLESLGAAILVDVNS